MNEPERIIDPALHRKLSEPFPSLEAANEALDNFQAEFRELRAKHRIPEVLVVVGVNVIYASGAEGRAMTTMFNGNSMLRTAMAAYAYGFCQQEDREFLNRLLAGKKNTT